jgi:Dullard-like phosphatase family protein
MATENDNDSKQILLPPQTSNKKTLVLDLDETLVHSQFMTFSNPSDVVIQIEVDNEIHDIHVMVRPGVKEFLEQMEKFYEIVIFTASVSKYADPLLDIIDKKGLCPFRLFREHYSLINATFVKDLKRLGRDLKSIIIVDNSPLSYSLHPQNGIPILTWFEDKSDRELFEIIPILEFLSGVPDVREFIPQFVTDNKIDYEKVEEIIKKYKGTINTPIEKKEEEKIKTASNNNKEINIKTINNLNDNYKDKKDNNKNKNISDKENIADNKEKLVELAMKNIIASVSPTSIEQNNKALKNKENSKNKLSSKKQINKNNEEIKKNNKEKNNIKIDTANIINVKKLTKVNNNAHSTKKFKASTTDNNFKTKQKRKNHSTGGNYIKSSSINYNTESKSIMIKPDNNNLNILVKTKNATPKINKTINLLNKNNHTTNSVKHTKKTNTYIGTPSSNNGINNKMHKSLTKGGFNSKNININKENPIKNKNNNNNNNIYKSFNTTTTNHNGLLKHKKQKSTNEFRTSDDIKQNQFKNSIEKTKKNKKIEVMKNKNNFLKTGYIQNKPMNNININLPNNLSLSNKFNNQNNININSFDFSKTNRGKNQIKFTLTNTNILKSHYTQKYSPNNRYKNQFDNNIVFPNYNINQNQHSKVKTTYKNKSVVNDKESNNNKSNKNKNNENKVNNAINRIKTTRPKSSSTKFEIKNGNKTNKVKYHSKMKFEINEILQKRGLSGKMNDLKKEIKKI